MFLWRLTHNSLPTLMNIKRKHIDLDTRCPMCLRLDEDGGHLFLNCKKVKAVWREQYLEDVRIALCECTEANEMMRSICSLPTKKKLSVPVLLVDDEKQNVRGQKAAIGSRRERLHY